MLTKTAFPSRVKIPDNRFDCPWTNALRLIVVRSFAARSKNNTWLAKIFSPGILLRSTCSNYIGFSMRVPFRLGCRLFSYFEVRFETIGKKLDLKHKYIDVLYRTAQQESRGRQ